MQSLQDILDQVLFSVGTYSLKIHMVVMVILIIIATKIILWIVRKMLFRRADIDEHERGNVQDILLSSQKS